MKIEFYIPRWGNRHLSWAEFTLKAKEAGYVGVEANLPITAQEQEEMFSQFHKNGLKWIGQHFETVTADFEDHLQQFETRLQSLAIYRPLFINSQTGKDFFTFDQNSKLIERAANISAATGLTILHETHRGKFSFCSTATAAYLQRYPHLQLTADFSHWCCVAESYLQDQSEVLQQAIMHTRHFHARVGFPGGPQVNDPSAPEWKEAVNFHCLWWDAIVQRQLELNSDTVTITCEFGPYPYMPQLPFSQKEVSDLWAANLYMKKLLSKKYAHI